MILLAVFCCIIIQGPILWNRVAGAVGIQNEHMLPVSVGFLGAENRRIAQSLRRGDGFGGPFGIPETPTSWHGPLYPISIATMLWLTGDDLEAAGMGVTCVHCVLLFMIVNATTKLPYFRCRWWLTTASFAAVVFSNYWYSVLQTNDGFLQFAILSWTLHLLVMQKTDSRPALISLGICGGMSGLVSPILFVIWFVLLSWSIATKTLDLGSPIRFVAVYALSALIVAPWVTRNLVEFHALIPTKSNLAFEIKQSICDCPNGVADWNTKRHPSSDRSEALLHAELGERQYLMNQWHEFFRCAQAMPLKLVNDVVYRAMSITFWLPVPQYSAGIIVETLQRLLYALPLSSLMLGFWLNRGAIPNFIPPLLFVFALFCFPYILIGFNLRYSVVATGLRAVFLTVGMSALVQYVANRPFRHCSR